MEVKHLEKIKIHELAKKLGVTNKVLLDVAKKLRFRCKKSFKFYY